MPPITKKQFMGIFKENVNITYDAIDGAIETSFLTEEALENNIILNSHINNEGLTKNDLGEIGMDILDTRYNVELGIKFVNEAIAKQQLLLLSIKQIEAIIRDLLPEFNINYDEYKKAMDERDE